MRYTAPVAVITDYDARDGESFRSRASAIDGFAVNSTGLSRPHEGTRHA